MIMAPVNKLDPSSEQMPNNPTSSKMIDITVESADSKSSDDDVLEILEDLETYAETMVDDFLEDSTAEKPLPTVKRPGVHGFLDLMIKAPWESQPAMNGELQNTKRKRNKKRKCPKCWKKKGRSCKCPKPVQIVNPNAKRNRYDIPPIYHSPARRPIVVPFPIVIPFNSLRRRPFYYHA